MSVSDYVSLEGANTLHSGIDLMMKCHLFDCPYDVNSKSRGEMFQLELRDAVVHEFVLGVLSRTDSEHRRHPHNNLTMSCMYCVAHRKSFSVLLEHHIQSIVALDKVGNKDTPEGLS